MIDIEDKKAYTEVLEILQYLNDDDYKKIPNDKIKYFYENENVNYHYKYNPNLSLNEQKVSQKTKYILAFLFCEYWANDKQKEMIRNKRIQDKQIEENNKINLYNPDNIFKKENNIKDNKTQKIVDLPMKIENKNFIEKIIDFIKNKFKYVNKS